MKSDRRRKKADLFRQSITSEQMKEIMDKIVKDIIESEKESGVYIILSIAAQL